MKKILMLFLVLGVSVITLFSTSEVSAYQNYELENSNNWVSTLNMNDVRFRGSAGWNESSQSVEYSNDWNFTDVNGNNVNTLQLREDGIDLINVQRYYPKGSFVDISVIGVSYYNFSGDFVKINNFPGIVSVQPTSVVTEIWTYGEYGNGLYAYSNAIYSTDYNVWVVNKQQEGQFIFNENMKGSFLFIQEVRVITRISWETSFPSSLIGVDFNTGTGRYFNDSLDNISYIRLQRMNDNDLNDYIRDKEYQAEQRGYAKGYLDGSQGGNVFTMITTGLFGFISIIGNIEILPNFKIFYAVGIVVMLGLIAFIIGKRGGKD